MMIEIRELAEKGLSQREMARHLGCSRYKVQCLLDEYGLVPNPHPDVVCSICSKEYVYNRKKGHTKTKCNSCMSNRQNSSRKKKALEYMGGECQLCGYKKCSKALAFHHKDPKTKDFTISGNHGRSWSSIEKELDKCVLLCNNCHAEVHSGMVDPAEVNW